jgi:hypothetical protein
MAMPSSPRSIVLLAVVAIFLDWLLMILLGVAFESSFVIEPAAAAALAAILGVITGVSLYGLTRLPAPQSVVALGAFLAILNILAIGIAGFIIEEESYAVLWGVMSGALMALSIFLLAWFLSLDTERDSSA